MVSSRGSIEAACARLAEQVGRVRIMEICGTHTMAIARHGLRRLLPETVELISGPGCPVCVTDSSFIEQARRLALAHPEVTIATYGDMVRVPGVEGSLGEARARGASVEVVYSGMQAVEIAQRRPAREVVFLGIGFETTAPGTALAVRQAQRQGVGNFSVLGAHKLIPPAMDALLAAPDLQIDGFLCPGHVSVILGWGAYEPIVRRHQRACVVAGFDAAQVMAGIAAILEQLAEDAPAACTVYPCVSRQGNRRAQELLIEFFRPVDSPWRGLGVIPGSGLAFRPPFDAYDAAGRFELERIEPVEPTGCRCGDVISGRCHPTDCGLFGLRCTPSDPVGACMVSAEGACAAAFKYGGARA